MIYGDAGQIKINGAAARLVDVGDRVIICAYFGLESAEISKHAARIVQVGPENKVVSVHTNAVHQP